jgi:hypothetical protein
MFPRVPLALLPVGISGVFLVLPSIGAANNGAGLPETPVAIRIEVEDRAELEHLTRLVSIDDVRGGEVQAVAWPSQLEKLEAAGWRWQVVPPTTHAAETVMCGAGWEHDVDRSWNCYPSYQQYEALMYAFAADYPTLCRLVDLGPTSNLVRPHRLWAMVISDNPDADEDEPEVLLTSTMHGDETAGFILTLRLIDHLTRGYGDVPEITVLVNESEIWINPLANPDGAYFGGDHTVADAIRFYTTSTGTASEVNPNRNFPDFDAGDHPDGNPWWLETEAMMALAEDKTFVLSANFHGGAEVVNYPWDTVARRHPDDPWFRDVALDWAELVQNDGPSGYMTSVSNDGVTNGYDWYQINGGRQDYMTYFHGGREVTIELSETKLLPSAELEAMWSWNRRALLDFITHAQEGIRGIVTGPGGAPLAATVEVLGVDREEDGSVVRTDGAVGDFHRLLLPGLYDLKIEAQGHRPEVVRGIAVVDGEATEIDVVLYPLHPRRLTARRGPPSHRSGPSGDETAGEIR